MARRTKPTPKKRAEFLDSLRAGNTVTFAAQSLNLDRVEMYRIRESDPQFAAAWDVAYAEGGEAMEQEAFRRAVAGFDKPVVYQGVITDTVKEYSDTLLIFLLKGRLPDKYRERVENETRVTGAIQHNVSVDLSQFTDDELAELERLAERALGPATDSSGARTPES